MNVDARPKRPMTRRRFVSVLAAAAAVPLVPRGLGSADPKTFTWEGVALGAHARLTLQHPDEAHAKAAIAACLTEVARLEAIFSLHQVDSALSRLNRLGRIDAAPTELRELVAEALALSRLSHGAFDVTIQPLWRLYAEHFESPGASQEGPSRRAIADTLRLVDWRKVEIDGAMIRLGQFGMAVTLNGIAQGYITDRVGALLRQRGFEHVLVNMGEDLALNPKWDGSSWTIGIADPDEPSATLTKLSLDRGAVATSGGYGYRFDRAGRFTHILDPKTGEPARRWASVTVIADGATLADGLSTALSAAPAEMASTILRGRGRTYLVPFGTGAAHWL
jgi:thiamine biosynthesis lipoprotein